MHISSKAIVINSLKYSEADLIVKLYTKSSGVRSYLLRGVLKSKRGKIRASLFQPLSILDIQAFHKEKNSLERIKEAKVFVPYKTLHVDLIKNALVFFISDVLKNALHEEEVNEPLYDYLETAFIWLDNNQLIGNFHIVFLTKLTKYLGFFPEKSTDKNAYFNMLDGVFQPIKSNKYCETGEKVLKLSAFLGTTFEASMNIKMSKSTRSEVLAMLLVYFELHLHGFKKPKSLSILTEIFN